MEKETLKDKSYKYIKNKIINCEYEPGYYLDEKLLIAELKASRTPIREALNKLEQENLIKIIPKRGVVVCQITLKNISDVYQTREIIEPAAILNFGYLLDKHKLTEFKSLFDKQIQDNIFDVEQAYVQDDIFHTFIVDCCNNKYFTNLMEDIRGQNQRIRIIGGKINNCIDDSIKEHIKVIDYILDNDYQKAAEEMKNHIVLSKSRTVNSFSL